MGYNSVVDITSLSSFV